MTQLATKIDADSVITKLASSRHVLHNPKSPFVYDFEVIRNCYTFVNYYYKENRFVIYAKGTTDLLDPINIIKDATELFEPVIKTRFNGVPPTYEVVEITPQNFLDVFETPQADAIGFNSVSYDTSIASFIVNYIKEYKILPDPVTVRQVSDLLINARKALELYPDLAMIAKDIRVYLKPNQRKMSIIDIDSIMHHRKMTWFDSQWNKIKMNWLASNHHIDILLINPVKTDEEKTEMIGLKRVAAQYGIQVVEPNLGINLGDSLAEITKDQLTVLLAYNTSDSFATYLILMDKLFQDQIKIRRDLLNDYADRFRNKVNINSTNAKLVQQYIAPDHALADDPLITTFFPVWDKKYSDIIAQIQATYPQGTTYQQMIDLDAQWTNWLQSQPEFGPAQAYNPFTQREEIYPRFQVRYGELQQDILEHMRETHKDFPIEAYYYYGLFRYTDDRRNKTNEFVNKFPDPPFGFTYGKKKHKYTNEDVYSIYYEFIVPGTDIRINCSVGGVHGDAMFAADYDSVASYITKRNNILAYLKELYGDDGTKLKEHIDEVGEIEVLPEFGETDLSKFITKTGKNRNFLKPILVPARKDFVSIVDLKKIVHADVTSLYPSIMIILRFFAEWDHVNNCWEDWYAKQKDIRVQAKNITKLKPKDQWTEVEEAADSKQSSAKLFLNNASGVIDSESQTNIRMNRKAVSMRLLGQLILLDLVFTVVENNGESVSTNTDGVYLTGIDIPTAERLVAAWEEKYALEAEPEVVDHFVSKDSNNRYEVLDNGETRNASGGMLSNFNNMNFVKKWTQPPVVDEALINYFDTHDNVPNTPIEEIDIESIKKFYIDKFDLFHHEDATYEERLDLVTRMCWPLQAGKNASATNQYFKLLKESEDQPIVEPLDKISRIVFTKSGYKLKNGGIKKPKVTATPVVLTPLESEMYETALKYGIIPSDGIYTISDAKITNYNDYRCTILNQDLSTVLDHPLWKSDIDIDAYVDMTYEKLKVWNNFSTEKIKKRKWHIVNA